MAFVHLHVHSQFSLLDGTMDPATIARTVAGHGMDAVALTDSGNLYGAVAFYKACKKHEIKAVIGTELFLDLEGADRRGRAPCQVIALVEDPTGYQNLCWLVTRAIFDGMHYQPRLDLELLRGHCDGLIFLTGGRKGLLGPSLLRGDLDQARAQLRALTELLGPEQLYLELQDLGLPGQDEINDGVRLLAGESGYHTVVTNAVHYAIDEDAAVHDLLNAISQGCSLADEGRATALTDQAWLKPEDEMRQVFPDDGEALDRTVEIAARCDFHFDFSTYHFPATTPPDATGDTDANWAYFYRAFPPPRDYGLPDPDQAIPPRPEGAGDLAGYFEWYASRGLELRLERVDPELHPSYWERLRHEFQIIEGMGFPAYLLIVAEFINWSKDNAIPVGPGRGSAAGSLVAWAMRITDIDPIRFTLLFERFLNPERVSMPDIDVDFCQDRREEAITHVREKYGADLVAQIITYGTLKAKAAVRDVARVLDLTFTEADRIAKLVPEALGTTLEEALAQVEQLRVLYDGDPKVRRTINLAQAVEGLCRQTGVHAAGVVIADKPLVEYAPLYRDEPEGGPVVQYDMKSAEGIGLIKFDFLGLKTLDEIRDAVAMVERNHGVRIDIGSIDEEDARTWDLLQRGDALGVFQVESSGMRDLLTRLKPTNLEDLIALVALFRPGPLSSGMVSDFVDRKHGRQQVVYPLPLLEPILETTYGTIVYQEQVMQIAQVMAGYSLGEADLLRRAMGKKIAAEMEKQRARFVDGSAERGIDRSKANEIFDLLAKFAAYGFNKSHSAAYGLISYQTAWLKANYRPEYMAALMTIEAANTDKLLSYIADCRRAGIRVEPVCINRSQAAFDAPPPSEEGGEGVIRFGLAAVKNVGRGAVDAIIEARDQAGGAFESAFAFFDKIDLRQVNRRVIENLIKAGAFDFDGLPRAALFAGLDQAMSTAAKQQADRASGQVSLFGAMASAARPPDFRFPDVPEWPLSKRLAFEKETLGFYLSGHPMEAHRHDVRRFATVPIHRIGRAPVGQEVQVIGIPASIRTIRTRRGDRMAFVQLEDDQATVECTFFSDPWAASQRVLKMEEPVLVKGKLEQNAGELKVLAESVELLSEVRARSTTEVCFTLTVQELAGPRLDDFVQLLRRQDGKCETRLVLRVPGRWEVELTGGPKVEPGRELMEGVATLFGRNDALALS